MPPAEVPGDEVVARGERVQLTAADGAGGRRNGMFTAAWEMTMDSMPPGTASLADILVSMRKTINGTFGGEQVMQLSTGHRCAITDKFPF